MLTFRTENGCDQRMGAEVRQMLVSEQDDLVAERNIGIHHEFVEGMLFAMREASQAHSLIATNLVEALGLRLHGRGCRVSSSDMKVRLAEGRRYYYPDIVVSCTVVQDEPNE